MMPRLASGMLLLWLFGFYIAYFFWYRFLRRTKDDPKSLTWVVIKSLKEFLFADDIWRLLIFIGQLCNECGGVSYGFMGFNKVYLISNPEDCQTVLDECPMKDKSVYRHFGPWLGQGILTAAGDLSKLHRKTLAKTMTLQKFEFFQTKFNQLSKDFVSKVATLANKGPIDIEPHLAEYNLNQVCSTVFGMREVKDVDWKKYLYARKEYMKILAKRIIRIHLSYDFIFSTSELKKKRDEMVSHLHESAIKINKQFMEELKEDADREGLTVEEKLKTLGSDNYMASLTKLNNEGISTDQDLIEQLATGIFGAHDSSTLTTMYALILLGSHPDKQEKAYREVQEVLGHKIDEDYTKEDLAKLVYLDAIIKETTRLYPYTPLLPRYIHKDTKLRNCTLRGGTTSFVAVFCAHRNPAWGPDPDAFRPERFLEDKKLPPHFGFSGGPRACMGRRYAMQSLKTTISRLLHKYKFKADYTAITHLYTGILEAKAGHHVEITPR